MRKVALLAAAAAAIMSCTEKQESMDALASRVFSTAVDQCKVLGAATPDDGIANSYDHLGKHKKSGITDWVSGFFPGTCWLVYEHTGNEEIKALAEKTTLKLASLPEPGMVTHHDIGFMVNCSYGNALRVTGDQSYRQTIIDAAGKLCERFSPTVGCIMSWNPNAKWQYPVIIDNMMNLEILCNATKLSGDKSYEEVALTHARTTIKNHFRPDFSTWHVVSYVPETGEIEAKNTAQGLNDDSAWARGQAWGLYGYTMMYRETGEADFLAQAENIARYLLGRLPEDGIPYWDFDCPLIPDTFRDSSAGAIMASAFVELSTFTKDAALADKCLKMAEKQIRTLASDEYLAAPGKNGGFLLRHGVGHLPGNSQIDVPLSYGDYYFLEAISRYIAL